jgi:hypothetical protein
MLSKYPVGEKKSPKNQEPVKESDNLIAKITSSQHYKNLYEKSNRFESPRKSAGSERKLNNMKVKQ